MCADELPTITGILQSANEITARRKHAVRKLGYSERTHAYARIPTLCDSFSDLGAYKLVRFICCS